MLTSVFSNILNVTRRQPLIFSHCHQQFVFAFLFCFPNSFLKQHRRCFLHFLNCFSVCSIFLPAEFHACHLNCFHFNSSLIELQFVFCLRFYSFLPNPRQSLRSFFFRSFFILECSYPDKALIQSVSRGLKIH